MKTKTKGILDKDFYPVHLILGTRKPQAVNGDPGFSEPHFGTLDGLASSTGSPHLALASTLIFFSPLPLMY